MTTKTENSEELTLRARQALQCLNTTQAPVFLTGNAGTGKTTFLKNLWKYTHKKFIVVAPTGIAALNAGGTTIHSQFLLPFGTFIPGNENATESFAFQACYNRHILARKHPLNSQRKKILRSIDLLVIDEVSMLRADLLDAIDYRLRSARGSYHQPFGGIQVLFIGDLYQLPPVVKREDELLLKPLYRSPWFFEAQALQHSNLIFIELDKIFRQQDDRFIRILNNLRHNRATEEDYAILNKQFRPDLEISKVQEVITLTTHNNQADTINQLALEQLPGNIKKFQAIVSGDFPPSMFPVPELLSLKKGCQIMFVKNDTESKSYFNGRLATVTGFSDDGVEVKMHDDGSPLTVKSQTWENKKYDIQQENQDVKESVVGTFEQLPVKLAWAITIHKSQGLTFDKAIIDPGRAFADGQVYVALSRLRALEGLILKTPIHSGVVSTDPLIVKFSALKNNPDGFEEELSRRQNEFIGQRIVSAFDFEQLIKMCVMKEEYEETDAENKGQPFQKIKDELTGQQMHTNRFREQLLGLLNNGQSPSLMDRMDKGVRYYSDFFQKLLSRVLTISMLAEAGHEPKAVKNAADEIDHRMMSKLAEIERLPAVTDGILNGKVLNPEIFEESDKKRLERREEIIGNLRNELSEQLLKPKTKKRKKRKADGKEPSHLISLNLFKSGKSLKEIASERNLAYSTIEVHISQAIEEGLIPLTDWVPVKAQQKIAEAIAKLNKSFGLRDLIEATDQEFSYTQIRTTLKVNGIDYERPQANK